jgi:hypothetical protein
LSPWAYQGREPSRKSVCFIPAGQSTTSRNSPPIPPPAKYSIPTEFEGTGNFLGNNQNDFLLYNSNNGQLWVGSVSEGTAQYTQVSGLGSEWQFLGTGNFDGTSQAKFMIRNSTNGNFDIGVISGGGVSHTQVGGGGKRVEFPHLKRRRCGLREIERRIWVDSAARPYSGERLESARLAIASGRGDGLLPDHREGTQPQWQELVFMPQRRLPGQIIWAAEPDRRAAAPRFPRERRRRLPRPPVWVEPGNCSSRVLSPAVFDRHLSGLRAVCRCPSWSEA